MIEQQSAPNAISGEDQAEILKLYERMRKRRARLVGPDGHSVNLPDSLYTFLCRLLADLSDGKCVSIVQGQAELTTVEAAAMLGVSRQFLVNLLTKNEIPHHMVGTHRRVYVRDVLEYKAKRDSRRGKLLDQLSAEEAADGLYDLNEPANAGPG
jgi:excisionase family DNA binding protein